MLVNGLERTGVEVRSCGEHSIDAQEGQERGGEEMSALPVPMPPA